MREQLDDTDGHPLTGIFEQLPSKKLYPDYYVIIQNPMALETILRKCKRGEYKNLSEVKEDMQTMFNNARFYNEEGSWVYNDADKLNEFVNQWFKDHQEE